MSSEVPIHKRKFFQILTNVLKVGLTLFIIWSIFRKMDLGEVLSSLTSQPWWLLAAILLLSVIRHGGQFLVWGYSLRINPLYEPNWKEILTSYMISQPLRFAIPGAIGMMGKILYITNSSLLATGLCYAIERYLVIWSIWCFAAVSGFFYFTQIQLWIRIIAVSAVILGPLWIYLFMGAKHKWKHLQEHYLTYAPAIIGIQIAISLIAYLQYWLLLQRVMPIGYGETVMRMSMTHFSISIPITWAGLGLRESFAIHFLSEAGFKALEAVTATLTLFLIQDVLFALIGVIFFLKAKKIVDLQKHALH